MKILFLNGPNLNLLGKRKTEIYGTQSFDSFFQSLKEKYQQHELFAIQSNHEGALIDALHKYGFEQDFGIIFNPGGYSHTSIALRDAVEAIETPVIEVHISDIHNRESFRAFSYLTDVCQDHIIGEGLVGYERAIGLLQSLHD